MNPQPQGLQADTFNIMMRDAFHLPSEDRYYNAAGIRKSCGARPKKIAPRFWGKGGLTRYNGEIASYNKCMNSVRDANVGANAPVDTYTPPLDNQQPTADYSPSLGGDSSKVGMYAAIAVGGLILLSLAGIVIAKVVKGKAVPVQA